MYVSLHPKSQTQTYINDMKQTLLCIATMLFCCCTSDSEVKAEVSANSDNTLAAYYSYTKMYITIDGKTQSVTLIDNTATKALTERLQQSPVNITLNSSGDFEIWGTLGFSLPTSDQQMTAQPGDVILYNGSNICLFYGSNSWSYTPLGRIDGLSVSELRSFLQAGKSNISVTLSLTSSTTAIKNVSSSRQDDGAYYSLNGARVTNPSKGIYVKNGKKVIL